MPLRYYNSVPEKYMIPNDYIYETTPEALACFRKICKESGDDFFLRLTKKYTDRKLKKTARFLSGKRGIRITDYIIDEIRNGIYCIADVNNRIMHFYIYGKLSLLHSWSIKI